jgi:hypothetical protein
MKKLQNLFFFVFVAFSALWMASCSKNEQIKPQSETTKTEISAEPRTLPFWSYEVLFSGSTNGFVDGTLTGAKYKGLRGIDWYSDILGVVADNSNNAIRVFRPDQDKVFTIAGGLSGTTVPTTGSSVPGWDHCSPIPSATSTIKFTNLSGVCFGPSSISTNYYAIYAADQGNGAIYRIEYNLGCGGHYVPSTYKVTRIATVNNVIDITCDLLNKRLYAVTSANTVFQLTNITSSIATVGAALTIPAGVNNYVTKGIYYDNAGTTKTLYIAGIKVGFDLYGRNSLINAPTSWSLTTQVQTFFGRDVLSDWLDNKSIYATTSKLVTQCNPPYTVAPAPGALYLVEQNGQFLDYLAPFRQNQTHKILSTFFGNTQYGSRVEISKVDIQP